MLDRRSAGSWRLQSRFPTGPRAVQRRDRAFFVSLISIWLLIVSALPAPGGVAVRPAEPAVAAAAAPLPAEPRDRDRSGAAPVKRRQCQAHDLVRLAQSKRCTHGSDPAPTGFDVRRSVAPLAPEAITARGGISATGQCDGDGSSGKRVQVLYAHAADVASRFAEYRASFRQWAVDADLMVQASAAETGGNRRFRFVTDASCAITVTQVLLSDAGDDSFDNMIAELQAAGYDRADRKYLVFVDTVEAGICGIGTIWADDRPSADNLSNAGPAYARVDAGCWSSELAAHELMHTLGAVQNSAPHATGRTHCFDEYDVMCYADHPDSPPLRYLCPDESHERRFDCGHDDYFHTNPPAGSYLATHWNAADNAFLVGGDGPPACPDIAFEPDNGPILAHLVAVGGTETHAFCGSDDDEDWVTFPAVIGTTYRIETRNLAPSVDTVLDLYRVDGTTLIESDDNSNGNRASLITFDPPALTAYFVRVRDAAGGAGGAGRTYDLRITALTGTPTLEVSPDSAKVGRNLTVTVRAFPADAAVEIDWDGELQTTVVTSADGQAEASFPVPPATKGKHTVRARAGPIAATANVTVLPSLTLSPDAGKPGERVKVLVDGYAAREKVTITWQGDREALKTVTASRQGSAATSITVPDAARPGDARVRGVGNRGSRAKATFVVARNTRSDATADIGTVEPAGDPGAPPVTDPAPAPATVPSAEPDRGRGGRRRGSAGSRPESGEEQADEERKVRPIHRPRQTEPRSPRRA